MNENAPRLDDGTRVFMDKNGDVYTEHGVKLSAEETEGLVFSEDASSWEDYQTLKKQITLYEQRLKELDVYQREVLDHTRERLDDQTAPPTYEELKELE